MHRTFIVAAVAITLLALGAAPAQASDSSDWENLFEGDPSLLRIEVGPDAGLFHVDDIEITGTAAQELRHAIDELPYVGNGNGEVEERELNGFEVFALQTVNAMLPSSFDLDVATLDGKAPYRADDLPVVQVRSLAIEGALGPVSSTAPVSVDISILLYFESVDPSLSVHTARVENLWGDLTGFDMEEAPPVEVRISGYKSWTIDRDSIAPAELQGHLDGDTLVFTAADLEHFQEEGSGLEFQVRGDPRDRILSGSTEESPAPAIFAMVLFALVGLAVARRRD